MLKFLILVAIILWIDVFFGHSEIMGASLNTSINVLSVIIITLILIGLLS